jgi:hypothetical protein
VVFLTDDDVRAKYLLPCSDDVISKKIHMNCRRNAAEHYKRQVISDAYLAVKNKKKTEVQQPTNHPYNQPTMHPCIHRLSTIDASTHPSRI